MSTVFSGDVLIVEDNFIIAMDAEAIVGDLGAAAVHLASSTADALAILDRTAITTAILDFNLEDETSVAVADALDAAGIPFVFATGYTDASVFPERYRARPMLKKPYGRDEIAALFETPPAPLELSARN